MHAWWRAGFLVTRGKLASVLSRKFVLDEWSAGASVTGYLADAVSDQTSALLVSAERMLAAEFPVQAQARLVLGAIGSGERTYSRIGQAALG